MALWQAFLATPEREHAIVTVEAETRVDARMRVQRELRSSPELELTLSAWLKSGQPIRRLIGKVRTDSGRYPAPIKVVELKLGDRLHRRLLATAEREGCSFQELCAWGLEEHLDRLDEVRRGESEGREPMLCGLPGREVKSLDQLRKISARVLEDLPQPDGETQG